MDTPPPHRRISKPEWGVLGFTLVYMGVSLLAALITESSEFLFYFVVMLLLSACGGKSPHRQKLR